MKKILLLFLFLPLMAFSAHKFYLSVTEIEYNSENKSLQVISRVFTDDMEAVLKERYNSEIFLTRKKEHPDADAFLKKYIEQRLKIVVNGELQKLNYLGKKYDNDQLVLFIEVENVPEIKSISVENKILTGLFPDQKNVVHIEFQGKTKSLLLTRDNESDLLNFD
ncbi:MAG TPA: DUF6702 family protein [Salinimicrobium sp.]|nr:DUF6702 family protein [Salinimicrobium sp.]